MNHAFVRPVSESLSDALSIEKPENPIDYNIAKQQHEEYVKKLEELLLPENIIEIESSKGLTQQKILILKNIQTVALLKILW
jgi:hypothetical protein